MQTTISRVAPNIHDHEQIRERLELYTLLREGIDDIRNNDVRPFSDSIYDIRERLSGS